MLGYDVTLFFNLQNTKQFRLFLLQKDNIRRQNGGLDGLKVSQDIGNIWLCQKIMRTFPVIAFIQTYKTVCIKFVNNNIVKRLQFNSEPSNTVFPIIFVFSLLLMYRKIFRTHKLYPILFSKGNFFKLQKEKKKYQNKKKTHMDKR